MATNATRAHHPARRFTAATLIAAAIAAAPRSSAAHAEQQQQQEQHLVVPAWDAELFKGHNASTCINATRGVNTNNSRWNFYAVPEGEPPARGWPVYLFFSPWNINPPNKPNATCGTGHGHGGPPPMTAACMAFLKETCPYTANASTCESCVARAPYRDKAAWKAAKCPPASSPYAKWTPYIWCKYHGHIGHHGGSIPIFEQPKAALASCFAANGTYDNDACSFMARAGQMWEERFLQ